MILKLYTVRNIKRDVFNPPFVLEDEKYLREVILSALINSKVDHQDLKDFEVHYLGDFDNTCGYIFDIECGHKVFDCSDLIDSYIESTNFENPPKEVGNNA